MVKVVKLLIVSLMVGITVFTANLAKRTAANPACEAISPAASTRAQEPKTAPSEQKTAEQVYRNIQVLKGTPADQLLGTMNFIAGSLGVACNHCHTNPFDKDDKPTKQRAREMILMMRKINQENFKGALEVNCSTCHQGKTKPTTTAPLARIDFSKALAPTAGESPAPMPSVDELLGKYVQALGGKDKVEKMQTLAMKGSRTDFNGP